jgi:hypothetical protein
MVFSKSKAIQLILKRILNDIFAIIETKLGVGENKASGLSLMMLLMLWHGSRSCNDFLLHAFFISQFSHQSASFCAMNEIEACRTHRFQQSKTYHHHQPIESDHHLVNCCFRKSSSKQSDGSANPINISIPQVVSQAGK